MAKTSVSADVRAALLSVAALLGCREPEPATASREAEPHEAPASRPARERIDVHVHLVDGAADELLTALDRAGIAKAVVIASPHLDPAHVAPPGQAPFSTWRAANDRILRETAGHRDRLLPFVTVEPAEVTPSELEAWLDAGACGVKLYAGHRSLHERPLDDPSHAGTFALLERRRVPLLLHVNTFRYEAELDRLLAAYPKLELVCPHLCSSRTDLDRLERLLSKHPGLRVDTSHGGGQHGIDGLANLERERERLRALIHAQPERFLFGSDLVTIVSASNLDATRVEWDRQLAANLGLLEDQRFEFRRRGEQPGSFVVGEYSGLALDGAVLDAVLVGNAERWLAGCDPGGTR